MKLPHERPGCPWLFASSGSRTMMEYYCTGGVLQYASGHLTPTELLHVHRMRERERVAKASPSLASHHAHGQGRDTASLTYCSCLCVYDRWAQQLGGPPIMQPKKVRLRHQSSVYEVEGVVVIKLLGLVRVDATHQSTALDIFK
mgnify:CR=1 FL=1